MLCSSTREVIIACRTSVLIPTACLPAAGGRSSHPAGTCCEHAQHAQRAARRRRGCWWGGLWRGGCGYRRGARCREGGASAFAGVVRAPVLGLLHFRLITLAQRRAMLQPHKTVPYPVQERGRVAYACLLHGATRFLEDVVGQFQGVHDMVWPLRMCTFMQRCCYMHKWGRAGLAVFLSLPLACCTPPCLTHRQHITQVAFPGCRRATAPAGGTCGWRTSSATCSLCFRWHRCGSSGNSAAGVACVATRCWLAGVALWWLGPQGTSVARSCAAAA